MGKRRLFTAVITAMALTATAMPVYGQGTPVAVEAAVALDAVKGEAIEVHNIEELKAAIEAVDQGGTIRLANSIEGGTNVEVAKTFTLDLGGFVMNGQLGVYDEGAHVTVKNGTLISESTEVTTDTRQYPVAMCKKGELTLGEGLIVEAKKADPGTPGETIRGVVGVAAYDRVNIEGAAINSEGYGIGAFESAEVYIKKAAVKAVSNPISTNAGSDNKVKLTIEDGEFLCTETAEGWANVAIYWASHGILDIRGGTFSSNTADAAALYVKNGTVNISGGTFEGTRDGIKIASESGDSTEINVDITNGIFRGSRCGIYVKSNGKGQAKGKYYVTVRGGEFEGEEYALNTSVAGFIPEVSFEAGRFAGGFNSATGNLGGFVSGGSYDWSVPAEYCADGYLPVEREDGTFEVEAGGVARIGEKSYPTLERAVEKVQNGETVVLMADVQDVSMLNITDEKNLNLDLNGHNMGFSSKQYFNVQGGFLNITGEGKVYEQSPFFAPILLKGSEKDSPEYSVVQVGQEVSLEGWSGVFIDPNDHKDYGIKVRVDGTIRSVPDNAGILGHGVYINGSINATEGNIPEIVLGPTSSITSKGNGIYAAGHAKWTLQGDITGEDALSVKSGIFNISSGTYHSTGVYTEPAGNSNGSENTGAALSITSNDDYAKKTEVTVTGGTFISDNGYGVYEGIAKEVDGNPVAERSYAKLSVLGGSFKGNTSKGAVSINEMADKKVIEAGYFNTPISSEYIAEEKMLIPNTGSNSDEYGYTIGEKSTETEVKPSIGEPEISMDGISSEDEMLIEEAAKEIEASGLDAYANEAVSEIDQAEAEQVKAEGTEGLRKEGVEIGEQEVTVYAQTFLDIRPKEFKKAEGDTLAVYTLDIVPMYRRVASTAATSEEIRLEAEGDESKNAVVVGGAEILSDANHIRLTIPLPAGFLAEDDKIPQSLIVKHVKENGRVYFHNGEVREKGDGDNKSYDVSFMNDQGFSTFTVLAAGTVAEVNGKGYASIQEAIAAAQEGQTVTLLKNVEVQKGIQVGNAQKVILDLNGHTITGSLTNDGTLTITDSKGEGKITGNITSNGTTYIKDGNFGGELSTGTDDGKFSITGGTFAENQLKDEYLAPGYVIDGNTVRPATPSGGGTTTPSYTITVPAETERGKVTASSNSANQGTTVTLTVEAKEGYELDELTVTDASGAKVELTQTSDGKFTFQMPGSNVEIKATFKVEGQQEQEIVILKAQARDLADRTLNDKDTKVKFAKGKAPKTDVTYATSNDKVVAVDEEGHIHYTGLGEAVITVKAVETEEYKAAEVAVTVKVGLKQPTFTPSARDNGFAATSSTVKGAEKFQVQYVLKGRSFQHDSAKSKTFTVDNKLRKGKVSAANKKTYRIRVRAISGDFKSKWSPVKTITTK